MLQKGEFKSRLLNIRYLLFTSVLLLLFMFVLPFYSVDAYSIIKHTTSQLGAQNTPNAWMMNVTFILVGISCLLEAWLHLGEFWLHKFLLSAFGLGLVLTGIFRHAPIVEGVIFDATADKLHSLFATVVGFSFTFFAISTAFIEKAVKHRVVDISVGVIATILSMFMGDLPDYSGIWQRAIFIISFAWLILMFERMRLLNVPRESAVHTP